MYVQAHGERVAQQARTCSMLYPAATEAPYPPMKAAPGRAYR